MRIAYRGPQFELAPQARRRRVALVEHGDEAARADDDIGEVACLDISKRIEGPGAVANQSHAGILSFDRAVGPFEPQRAFVTVGQPPDLQFHIARHRGHAANLGRPAVECGARAERNAVRLGCGEESLSAVPAS